MRQTPQFTSWLAKLRDRTGRAKILKRVIRARAGNLGDVASVGGGISEMQIFHGPGYRVYFVTREKRLVILLCGGDKSTQADDIRDAKQIAREIV